MYRCGNMNLLTLARVALAANGPERKVASIAD
jgi:hypothetical protein